MVVKRKRKYNVKGTNDFLVLALFFFFLCLWAVKDGWFPSDKTLKKHPPEVEISFEVAGSVKEVLVHVDGDVGKGQVIALLHTERKEQEYKEAQEQYTKARKDAALVSYSVKNAKENGASDAGIQSLEKELVASQAQVDALLVKVNELNEFLSFAKLESPTKGKVLEVLVQSHDLVSADDAVLRVDTKDHFYIFNKSLTIVSFLAFWAFLAVHLFSR